MIEATLIMVATLVVAIVWIVWQQRQITATHKRLVKVEQRLRSAKLTLTNTKEQNEALEGEVVFLKNILFDVAKGDAHVWIEDDQLRAARTAAGKVQVH